VSQNAKSITLISKKPTRVPALLRSRCSIQQQGLVFNLIVEQQTNGILNFSSALLSIGLVKNHRYTTLPRKNALKNASLITSTIQPTIPASVILSFRCLIRKPESVFSLHVKMDKHGIKHCLNVINLGKLPLVLTRI
jgi:hypothetical protein